MTWSEEAWKAAEPIYKQILELDFIKELGDGTLSRDRFNLYLAQDKLYLADYAKALSLISARCESVEDTALWATFAISAGTAEQEVHNYYLAETSDSEPATKPRDAALRKSPSCELYTSFLLKHTALSPIEVAAAAVLPCFWIYAKVGEWHYSQLASNAEHPFHKWISAYAGEDFEKGTQAAINFANKHAEATTPERRKLMTEAYIQCSIMELMFWKSAYEKEKWPVAGFN